MLSQILPYLCAAIVLATDTAAQTPPIDTAAQTPPIISLVLSEVTNTSQTQYNCVANETSIVNWTINGTPLNLTTSSISVMSYKEAISDSNTHHLKSVLTIPNNYTDCNDNITLECCNTNSDLCSSPVIHMSPIINCNSTTPPPMAQANNATQTILPAQPVDTAVLGGTISAAILIIAIITLLVIVMVVLQRRKRGHLNLDTCRTCMNFPQC